MSWLILLVIGLVGSGETSQKAVDLKLKQGTGVCYADRKYVPSYTGLNLHGTRKRHVSS